MLDIDKLPKDTVVTTEMLNPQQGERIMVIEHFNTSYEAVRYNGTIEVDAFRKYLAIKHKDKIIVKASVTYSKFFNKWTKGKEFILDYEIKEIIKKG